MLWSAFKTKRKLWLPGNNVSHGIQTPGMCWKTMEEIQGVWQAGTGYQQCTI